MSEDCRVLEAHWPNIYSGVKSVTISVSIWRKQQSKFPRLHSMNDIARHHCQGRSGHENSWLTAGVVKVNDWEESAL